MPPTEILIPLDFFKVSHDLLLSINGIRNKEERYKQLKVKVPTVAQAQQAPRATEVTVCMCLKHGMQETGLLRGV